MHLVVLIAHYGDAAVFLGCGLEGETAAFLSGVMARNGLLSWTGVYMAAASGSFFADEMWFLAGRYGRRFPIVQRLMRTHSMAHVLCLLDRYQSVFVIAFRFVYGMRVLGPVAVGASEMPAYRFVLLNAVAALVWALLITSMGYYFASIIKPLLGDIGMHWQLALALLGTFLLSGALLLARRRLVAHAKSLIRLTRIDSRFTRPQV